MVCCLLTVNKFPPLYSQLLHVLLSGCSVCADTISINRILLLWNGALEWVPNHFISVFSIHSESIAEGVCVPASCYICSVPEFSLVPSNANHFSCMYQHKESISAHSSCMAISQGHMNVYDIRRRYVRPRETKPSTGGIESTNQCPFSFRSTPVVNADINSIIYH